MLPVLVMLLSSNKSFSYEYWQRISGAACHKASRPDSRVVGVASESIALFCLQMLLSDMFYEKICPSIVL
jgi:hypothetical protein